MNIALVFKNPRGLLLLEFDKKFTHMKLSYHHESNDTCDERSILSISFIQSLACRLEFKKLWRLIINQRRNAFIQRLLCLNQMHLYKGYLVKNRILKIW